VVVFHGSCNYTSLLIDYCERSNPMKSNNKDIEAIGFAMPSADIGYPLVAALSKIIILKGLICSDHDLIDRNRTIDIDFDAI